MAIPVDSSRWPEWRHRLETLMNKHGFRYTSSLMSGAANSVFYDFENEERNIQITFVLAQSKFSLCINRNGSVTTSVPQKPSNLEIFTACETLFTESGIATRRL